MAIHLGQINNSLGGANMSAKEKFNVIKTSVIGRVNPDIGKTILAAFDRDDSLPTYPHVKTSVIKQDEELLLVITPENLCNILKKKKTRELRTFIPKNFHGYVNLYCTFGTALIFDDITGTYTLSNYKVKKLTNYGTNINVLNGRVVARFWFDDFTCYFDYEILDEYEYHYHSNWMRELLEQSCVTIKQIREMVLSHDYLYAWHIKYLQRFVEPLKVSDFVGLDKSTRGTLGRRLKKAPRSYQYVYLIDEVSS